MEEYIVCSAICDPEQLDMTGKNPLVHCGLRHNYILWQGKHISRNPKHQGFLTSGNRYVGRIEAMEIALKMGQVVESELQNPSWGLFSEDLFKQKKIS